MQFSSLVFLCIFLPVVVILYRILPGLRAKNALLVAASLVFYAYGEPVYVLLMIASAVLNWLFALAMNRRNLKKPMLVLAVLINIGLLCVFKYAGFLVSTANGLLSLSLPVPQITLPIGISFFTFQALSYVIDAYRGDAAIQKNFFRVLLYISFFPQLIAGPIVKYQDIADEIESRSADAKDMAEGLRRFCFGLAKKVLIANTMAQAADALFDGGATSLNLAGAWIGAVSYMLQIYFDFSGYSDMAIGLGRMFGFHFRENFLDPYTAVSIKEFWRRWHVSLSSWFRDYVYIPLGGNRRGRVRTGANKWIVFFLTGLWHGANWTFVVWGLFHGFFSFLEELVPAIRRLPRVLGHLYTLLVVCCGFVLFRAETIKEGLLFLGRMFFGFDFSASIMVPVLRQLTPWYLVMLLAAVAACAVPGVLARQRERVAIADRAQGTVLPARGTQVTGTDAEKSAERMPGKTAAAGGEKGWTALSYAAAFALLAACLLRLSAGSYNPFIYFRF